MQKLEATLAQPQEVFQSKLAEQQKQIEALTAGLHHDDGKLFVVHADEILTAFLELETGIPGFGQFH